MKNISRLFLFGASILVLLTAACAGQQGSPTPVGTLPGGPTASPPPLTTETAETATTGTATTEATADGTMETPTAGVDLTGTATSGTPGIPVTGNILLLECQFCIDTFAQALLVIPGTASFEVLTPAASVTETGDATPSCNMVDTFNGRQTILCRAPENTSLDINVCDGTNNCQQLTIQLQSCPQSTTPAAATNTPGTDGEATATPTPALDATPTTGATLEVTIVP